MTIILSSSGDNAEAYFLHSHPVSKTPMATLLSLPLELRSQIYLDTLSRHPDQPPTDRQILSDEPISSFWGFSFPPALLFANKQIHAEVKHVFYGKNTWVMVASMQQTSNTLPPTAAIPYVRTALLKIHLDARKNSFPIQYKIDENCRMLCRIPTLQALRIECAENTSLPVYPVERDRYFPLHKYSAISLSSYLERNPHMREAMNECLWGILDTDQALVSALLQPLLALPGTCSLRKGDICVERGDVVRARILERAFSNCLDAVIALRLSP